jgi:hypothetical protein
MDGPLDTAAPVLGNLLFCICLGAPCLMVLYAAATDMIECIRGSVSTLIASRQSPRSTCSLVEWT